MKNDRRVIHAAARFREERPRRAQHAAVKGGYSDASKIT
jgi:hypothetical protein